MIAIITITAVPKEQTAVPWWYTSSKNTEAHQNLAGGGTAPPAHRLHYYWYDSYFLPPCLSTTTTPKECIGSLTDDHLSPFSWRPSIWHIYGQQHPQQFIVKPKQGDEPPFLQPQHLWLISWCCSDPWSPTRWFGSSKRQYTSSCTTIHK